MDVVIDLISNPSAWLAFGTLTVMEVVLGIDNIVFISVLVSRLPKDQADRARRLGIALALAFRIVLLLLIAWIVALDQDVIEIMGIGLSWKDLILIAGGGFLVYKATHEMHAAIEEPHEDDLAQKATAAFAAIIMQIIIIDMVFSIDSIITAVGMVPDTMDYVHRVTIMIAAVIVAVGVMLVASGPIAHFVAQHPTTKMLALAFLLLIGVSLVADGLGAHIDKGYIYAAMGFSVLVEAVNIAVANRRKKRAPDIHRLAAAATLTQGRPTPALAAAGAAGPQVDAATKPRRRTASRSQAAPKSAPRKKK
jgi:predicted tellurium resistance membrane protein TerC